MPFSNQPAQTNGSMPSESQQNPSNPAFIVTQESSKKRRHTIIKIIGSLIFLIIIAPLGVFYFVKYAQAPVARPILHKIPVKKIALRKIKNPDLYTDVGNKFSIQYPSSWNPITPKPGVVGFSTNSGPYKGTIIVLSIDYESSKQDLSDIMTVTKPVNNVKMNNQVTKTAIHGYSFNEIVSTTQSNTNSLVAEAYYYVIVPLGPNTTLRFTTDPKDQPVVDQMLPTFKLLK